MSKAINELPELPAVADATEIPVDSGIQTFRTSALDFWEYVEAKMLALSTYGRTLVVSSSQTATFTAAITTEFYLCDATSGAITANLPTAVGIAGHILWFLKSDSSANAVTIDGSGTETIGGWTTFKLSTQRDLVGIISDGTNWRVLSARCAPVVTPYTAAATGTHTTTPGAKRLRVRMAGGAGGGAGSGTAGGGGGAGGDSIFGTRTAGGGNAGARLSGGAGGSNSGTGYTIVVNLQGETGKSGSTNPTTANGAQAAGGAGGGNPFGGAGAGGGAGSGGAAAKTGSGCGGGGGGNDNLSGSSSGGGGGAGGYLEFWITDPAATYSYTVGAAGTAGAAGTGSARGGGVGSAGAIYVEEFFD